MLVGSEGQVVEVGAPGTEDRRSSSSRSRRARACSARSSSSAASFDEDARMTAASLVGHAVIALENARLHRIVERQALVDGLTGLANRRQAEDALASELARAGALRRARLRRPRRPRRLQGRQRRPRPPRRRRRPARVRGRARARPSATIDLAARWGGEEFAARAPGHRRRRRRARSPSAPAGTREGRTLLTPDGRPGAPDRELRRRRAPAGGEAAASSSPRPTPRSTRRNAREEPRRPARRPECRNLR